METPLLKIIRNRIRQQGPMDLGEYMALCLGHPEHGYYMTRDPFGVAGDFITAPEISQMFGEMIGLWLADIWMKMGSPSEFILLECGPGRGVLMEDIMRTTRALPGFHSAARLFLMEISPYLRNAQEQRLNRYSPTWIHDLSQLPASVPVFIVANEFLDALPIRQIVFKEGEWRERVVALDANDTLCLDEKRADLSLVERIPREIFVSIESKKSSNSDNIFETAPLLNQFLKQTNNLLLKQSGVALFLDYGLTQSSFGDTLQAVRSHQYAGIFDAPGLCDLTAHVNFENLVRISTEDGVAVHGPVTQRGFLRELGIEVRAERLMAGANSDQKEALLSGLRRLIDTEQMGSLFKVLALCNDPAIEVEGFHEGL